MKQVLDLQPMPWAAPAAAPLSFVWDEDAGDVSGRDAPLIHEMAAAAVRAGSIRVHPEPSDFPISDPLRDRAQFAALLGYAWVLPDWLAESYPQVAEEVITDDQGNAVPLVY